jgi:hypothetical protein
MNQEYIILCLGILLLLYILYTRYSSHQPRYNLYNGPYWANPTDVDKTYRLGDLIYNRALDYNYLTNVKKKWPDSIGDKYLRYVGFPQKNERLNYDIIDRILREMNNVKPDKNTLVIHLRLGDTVTIWNQGIVENWMINKNHYVKGPEYYKNLIPILKQNKDIHTINIVTGAHLDEDLNESCKYLDHIIDIFKNDYTVNVKITNNPDKDFYYMCHSEYFCPSGGGYSNLVKSMVQKYNKHIIE